MRFLPTIKISDILHFFFLALKMSNSITFTRGDAIVSVDVAGHTLRLQQSSTPVLGTTVWDSSIVQLQYLAATKACRQALAGECGPNEGSPRGKISQNERYAFE